MFIGRRNTEKNNFYLMLDVRPHYKNMRAYTSYLKNGLSDGKS
jgi:hypothetical protein